MNMWIDDVRIAPVGWRQITSVKEAILCFCQHCNPDKKIVGIDIVSMDHDAGEYAFMGGDYIQILKWMEIKQNCYGWDFSNIRFHMHSANPVGVKNMETICKVNGWRIF